VTVTAFYTPALAHVCDRDLDLRTE